MSRTFKTVDYEATLNQTVRLGDCLPYARTLRDKADSCSRQSHPVIVWTSSNTTDRRMLMPRPLHHTHAPAPEQLPPWLGDSWTTELVPRLPADLDAHAHTL